MGRKRKSEDDLKIVFPIRLSGWLVKSIRSVPKYTPIVECILSKYFSKDGLKDEKKD